MRPLAYLLTAILAIAALVIAQALAVKGYDDAARSRDEAAICERLVTNGLLAEMLRRMPEPPSVVTANVSGAYYYPPIESVSATAINSWEAK